MELVVDAKVLVAGFLRTATTRELLLDEQLTLWAPEHGLAETERVVTTPRFRKRLGRISPEAVQDVLQILTQRIQIVPASTYQRHLARATQLAPHPEDAPYLAVALHLGLPVWSNDADLKTSQHLIPVYTTLELLARLRS